MELTIEQQQILIGAASGVGILLIAVFAAILKARKARKLALAATAYAEELAGQLETLQQSLKNVQSDAEVLARRLDLFEATHREAASEPLVDGPPPAENMTERRHRVVALAARGQAPDMIASTIGMLTGEVELILNLENASRRAHIQ